MPKFEIEWRSRGTAVVEADDATEAGLVLEDALNNFETLLLDEIDVDEVMVDTPEELE